MRLGIISDTHGHEELTREAVRMLESLEVEEVIHCGDIGSKSVVPMLSAWPTHFVLGNVDSNDAAWRDVIEAANQTFHGRFGEIEREGCKIAFLHGDDSRRLRLAVESGKWQLVCSGHTHVASMHRHGDTIALNPGAVYRANPHSIAVVELPTLEIQTVSI